MSDTEEKSVMDTLIEAYTSNGEQIIWQNGAKSKVVILKSEYRPELVILTQEGLGVRVATVYGYLNANGHPARIYY